MLQHRKATLYRERASASFDDVYFRNTNRAALGFPITAYVLQNHDWHTTFYVMGVLTLLMAVFVLIGLKDVVIAKDRRQQKADHKTNFKVLASNPGFWIICIFNISLMTYLWGLNSWIPTYLIEEKNFNLKSFGMLSSIPFISMLVGKLWVLFIPIRCFISPVPNKFFLGYL
nr:MFS transporter [Paenalcaligenes hominis]